MSEKPASFLCILLKVTTVLYHWRKSIVFFLIFSPNSFPISASGERSDEIPPDTECPDSTRVPTQERGRNKKT